MIHKCWPLGTFLTPFPFRPSLYLFPCITHHALLSFSFFMHSPPSFPSLTQSLLLFSSSSPSICTALIYNFRGQDAALYNRAGHRTVSPFLCSQLIHPETGSSWGRPQQNRKWWRRGVKERAGRARIAWAFFAWFGPREKWDACGREHLRVIIPWEAARQSFLFFPFTDVTRWGEVKAWHGRPGWQRAQRGAKRGKEAKSKKK